MPRFSGGFVGYFGYETIRYIEPKLNKNNKEDPIGSPDILLMVSDEVVVFDNLSGKLFIIVHADPKKNNAYSNALQRLDDISGMLRDNQNNKSQSDNSRDVDENDFVSGFTQKNYEKAVDAIKNYIVNGDAMQVVLSQRFIHPIPIKTNKLI